MARGSSGGHPGRSKPASKRGDYLGTDDPPRGWLMLNEGIELTCNREGYWRDPGHKRQGHHLVALGGELMEMSRVKADATAYGPSGYGS